MRLVCENLEIYRIWVDAGNRVASFKQIDAGELIEFLDYEMYEKYLLDLTARWYLFQ